MSKLPVLEAIADSALLLRFTPEISAANTARIVAVAEALRAAALPGVADIVPGYASVTVVLAEDTDSTLEALGARVSAVARAVRDAELPAGRLVALPVAYGGECGPDLDALATELGLPAEEIVRRHTAVDYTVAMVGFLPGFPYLVGLDATLESPRRATPRVRVPAGSVGIGGAQTGVYPVESPGGWQLIGRTAARLFEPDACEPSLLRPADRVQFRAVPECELARTPVVIDGEVLR